MSTPCQPCGILSDETTLSGAVFKYVIKSVSSTSFCLGVITVSSGSVNFTPLSSAFFIILLASSNLSSSHSESPISYPFAFKKVYAIPPPISNSSTLLNKFSITPILSETLAPPRIATNGFSGCSKVPFKNSISSFIKYPATASST